jgi:hypothetical protein
MKNAIHDAMVITKRQLLQLARVPELLVFSTIQPVMFVLLFRFVFGGSIDSGQKGGYVQLLMPGIFVQTVAFTLASTAIGLAEDMKKGLIDRFRSLPISRGAVIIGRTFGDALLNILVLAVMASNLRNCADNPCLRLSLYVWLRTFLDWNLGWPLSERSPHRPKRCFLSYLPFDFLI